MEYRSTTNLPRIVLLSLVLFGFLGVQLTHAEWWDKSFTKRIKINIDTSSSGVQAGEALRDFPALLRLHKGNIDFADVVDQERAKDIRIIAPDEKTQLFFHVDTFDTVNEILLVWVKIPELKANTTENVIWLYYGKEGTESVENPGGSYDADTVCALHFNEREGAFTDATQYGNNSEPYASHGLSAVFGKGVSVIEPLVVPLKTPIEPTGGITAEVMFKLDPDPSDGILMAVGTGADAVRVEYQAGSIYLIGGATKVAAGTQVAPDSWYTTALTVGGEGAKLYINGAVAAEAPAVRLAVPVSRLSFGGLPEGGRLFPGELDEVNISRVARSAGWMKLAGAAKGAETKLFRFSEGDDKKGGVDWYRIFKPFIDTNIIGWIINGIIISFGLAVIIVGFRKSRLFKAIDEDEIPFLEEANNCASLEDYTTLAGREEEFSNSPAFRAFRAAHLRLLKLIESGHHHKMPSNRQAAELEASKMSGAHFASVRVAMEGWMTDENRKINAELLVLTLAIAAAPFFGLLGTIWGVMETFTGLALSGEANILAVAPGVASALTTTLFGLIVAIPGLIVYNLQGEKAKNIVLRMYAFSDDYLIRVEPEVI